MTILRLAVEMYLTDKIEVEAPARVILFKGETHMLDKVPNVTYSLYKGAFILVQEVFARWL